MFGSDLKSHHVAHESDTEVTSAMGGESADSIALGYTDKVPVDQALEAKLIERAKSRGNGWV